MLDGMVFCLDDGKSVGCYDQVALKSFLLTARQHWDAFVLRKEIRCICECLFYPDN